MCLHPGAAQLKVDKLDAKKERLNGCMVIC